MHALAGYAGASMCDQDLSKEEKPSWRRAYEPMLHLVGLPLASLLLFGLLIYGLLTLLGVFAAPIEGFAASTVD